MPRIVKGKTSTCLPSCLRHQYDRDWSLYEFMSHCIRNSTDRPNLLHASVDCEMSLLFVSPTVFPIFIVIPETRSRAHLREDDRWRQNYGHQPHQHDGPPAVADGAQWSGLHREYDHDEPVTGIDGDVLFCRGHDILEKPAASVFTFLPWWRRHQVSWNTNTYQTPRCHKLEARNL